MSIRGAFALPQDITFGETKAKLHPMSVYELGLCESSYTAFCTRQALEATIGLPETERKTALLKAAERVADLDVDVTPVYDWIVGSYEGLCRVLACCIELADGTQPSPRAVGQWYEKNGKQEEGSPVFQWMVDSRLRPDPTELALPQEEGQPKVEKEIPAEAAASE